MFFIFKKTEKVAYGNVYYLQCRGLIIEKLAILDFETIDEQLSGGS